MSLDAARASIDEATSIIFMRQAVVGRGRRGVCAFDLVREIWKGCVELAASLPIGPSAESELSENGKVYAEFTNLLARPTVAIYDALTGRQARVIDNFNFPPARFPNISGIALDRDGLLLAVFQGPNLNIFNTDTGALVLATSLEDSRLGVDGDANGKAIFTPNGECLFLNMGRVSETLGHSVFFSLRESAYVGITKNLVADGECSSNRVIDVKFNSVGDRLHYLFHPACAWQFDHLTIGEIRLPKSCQATGRL